MGWIGEVIEGTIKGIYSIFKKGDGKINGWTKLHKNEVPNWVERAGHKFHKHHRVRHHDLRRHFKGDNYIYRIYFKKAAHGRVEEEYYRKKRN